MFMKLSIRSVVTVVVSYVQGVMVSHGNIVATAAAVRTIIPGIGRNDVYLAYLPLAHVLELAAEVVIQQYCLSLSNYQQLLIYYVLCLKYVSFQTVMLSAGSAIGYGSALTLTDTSNKIKKGTKGDASVLKPTLMATVPAILDRVRDGVLKKVDSMF